jgi:hypothetical protein
LLDVRVPHLLIPHLAATLGEPGLLFGAPFRQHFDSFVQVVGAGLALLPLTIHGQDHEVVPADLSYKSFADFVCHAFRLSLTPTSVLRESGASQVQLCTETIKIAMIAVYYSVLSRPQYGFDSR